MLHRVLDYFGFPRHSDTGVILGIFGRLTHGWLVMDDPDDVARYRAKSVQ